MNPNVSGRSILLLSLLFCLGSLACQAPSHLAEAPTEVWEGTVEEEGGVRTITTTAGSVWQEGGHLVEEVAIGTETRGPNDVLGRVVGVESAHEKIFILDSHDATVRVYDWEGNHLQNIGRRGEGPGELGSPADLEVHPVTGDLVVREGVGVLSVFSANGGFVNRGRALANMGVSGHNPLVRITAEGEALVPCLMARFGPEIEGGFKQEWVIYTVDSLGTKTDSVTLPLFEHEVNHLRASSNPRVYHPEPVPFAPQFTWGVGFRGEIITGVPEDYAIELLHRDGDRTVIRRMADAVPVHGGEKTWAERKIWGIMRDFEPGWRWEGPEIPETKAWYSYFFPDRDGRLWVLREGEGRETEDDSEPDDWKGWRDHQGWVSDYWFEVFELDSGRYLGRVEAPDHLLTKVEPYVKGDVFIALTEDEAGRPIVRRYRLDLPSPTQRRNVATADGRGDVPPGMPVSAAPPGGDG